MADAVLSEPSGLATCAGCGAGMPGSLLACPACHRLRFADELRAWAAEAEAAEQQGDVPRALSSWRLALDHLPAGSRQRTQIQERIAALSAAPRAKAGKGAWLGGGAALAALLSKAKFLALGFTKLGTLLSMFAALGVYGSLWGWKFAAGFILSIYVHEMGHVAALARVGIAASAPMFIPGLGAFVRLKQYPSSPGEDAYVGLAGPVWGLVAAAVCAAGARALDSGYLLALAHTGAVINLFNLLPIGSLDGGRGFRALTSRQRWGAVALVGATWLITQEGMLLLVLLGAVFRAFRKDAPERPDLRAMVTYAVLIVALAAISATSQAAR